MTTQDVKMYADGSQGKGILRQFLKNHVIGLYDNGK
jgi:hypothetical protein